MAFGIALATVLSMLPFTVAQRDIAAFRAAESTAHLTHTQVVIVVAVMILCGGFGAWVIERVANRR
ncbi:MAG: hypothetical protein KDA99_21625 [Planctomycetales bacterium]|nr:hypothetical protein [Planctomycetales bacterium]